MLRTVLSLIPDTLFDTTNAQTVANSPTRFTGYMSWVLYYARFSLNLFLLLKHTFGPELSESEKLSTTPYWDRFKTQWRMRKYTLLNDSLWGLANMVCFFWFVGSDGDLLTIFLLCFDLYSAYYEYAEEQCLYEQTNHDFDTQIAKLKQQLEDEKDISAKKDLYKRIKKLEKDQKECVRAWEHKKIGLISATVYAGGLLIAFVLATLPFLPIAAPTLLIITTIGATLCFALTVINNGMKQGLEVRGTYLSKIQAKSEYTQMIADFKQLLKGNAVINESEKILLFLEIKQCRAEEEYQQELVIYQTLHLVRTMIIQTMIPVLLFTSFLFLPMATGILVVGAALILAMMTHLLIEKLYKTEKTSFPEFDKVEYQAFCDNPDLWLDKPVINKNALFNEPKLPGRGEEVELQPLLNPKAI
ncbi:MAG: hypothetical protein EPN84_01550 [Legionella sp.]|nr:MAG: hypothetical protein EPN84_01550 [Legionella sp.]